MTLASSLYRKDGEEWRVCHRYLYAPANKSEGLVTQTQFAGFTEFLQPQVLSADSRQACTAGEFIPVTRGLLESIVRSVSLQLCMPRICGQGSISPPYGGLFFLSDSSSDLGSAVIIGTHSISTHGRALVYFYCL
ncbi:hypothetical protein PIB30_026358 [Stylosanthes scabra]|uniref:Uncharacterized protein n=1 Tax=Stylosanthes scabra TaxID=79078 RepID=A0ABU6Z739_9FABA|nr:hypothetical protein [Stylosanthes scabra]